MPIVYDMPPISYTAQSQGLENARNMSSGISGARRISQTRKSRRLFSIEIPGIGPDRVGEGYIEQLRRYVDGKLPLVRIEVRPDGWHIAAREMIAARGHGAVTWRWQGGQMSWRYQGQPLAWWWSALSITPGIDYGGDYVYATGLQPSTFVAMPGELVRQGSTEGRVRGAVRSNASGDARIYVDQAFQPGHVLISPKQYTVAVIDELSPILSPSSGNYGATLTGTEAFASDYVDGFQYENPWRAPI